MDKEYIAVVAVQEQTTVCVFTDREEAVKWFKKLVASEIPATITTVELNTAKPFMQEFGF